MYQPDTEKTTFITPHRVFYYNVMPFGLKNAGATYQRHVTKMFRPLLGKNMEVYIVDMLVKSKERSDHTTHLQEAFDLLRAYEMKLNPLKCAFRVNVDRFLGFMVSWKQTLPSLRLSWNHRLPVEKRDTIADRPVSCHGVIHFFAH